jgi:hypothetical protein
MEPACRLHVGPAMTLPPPLRVPTMTLALLAVSFQASGQTRSARAVEQGLAPAARHVALLLSLDSDGLQLLKVTEVEQPLPQFRSESARPWRVTIDDADGTSLFSTSVPAATELRVEYATTDGKRHGQTLHLPSASFVVRLPRTRGAATVRLSALAKVLADGDPRKAAAGPEQRVDLGSIPWPVVER